MVQKTEASPRGLALATLLALARGKYGNLAVDATLRRVVLSDPDRHLYTVLVYGVTERQTTLDYLIGRFSDRPLEELDETVRMALRLGLYQLVYLDRVPDHAAIHETVALVPRRVSGYVNAVLRAYLRFEESLAGGSSEGDAAAPPRENRLDTPAAWADRFPELAADPMRAASVAYGMPEALCALFTDSFGAEEAGRLMAAFCRKPPLTLRTNTLRTDRDSLLASLTAAGLEAAPGLYAPEAIRVQEGAVVDLPAFAAGDFFVQDEASQLCVQALDARPGMTVVDTCACPGSKSFGAALSMGNSGTVYAFDLHESKLSLVRSGAARLGLTVITADQRDARCPDPALYGRADRVLCDVPCSGLGVLAKKPEIRHKDLPAARRLPAIQREILERSAAYVKSGGLLVYSTCTLLPAENSQVVGAFLADHPDFVPDDFAFPPLPGAGEGMPPVASRRGMVTLTPHRNGTDGFFIARMRRVGKEGVTHD